MNEQPLTLFVSAPVAAFRVPYAREYLETLPAPPPATVYGMLLSLIGETDRRRYVGTELGLMMLSTPALSTVIRTSWRLKSSSPPGTGNNKTLNYQELLTDVRLVIWLRSGELAEQVRRVVDREVIPSRFGGLALGESTHLVDELRRWRKDDGQTGRLLQPDPTGDLAMPRWVDHVGSAGTVWGQYRLAEATLDDDGQPVGIDEIWSRIELPAN